VIDGQDTRTVTIQKGATVGVDFAVGCFATGFRITTHTTGSDFPDAYQLVMAGFNPRTIGVNEEVTFSRLAPGTYKASLVFPGENCVQVSEREVTAVVTNRALTPMSFDVECRPPSRLEKIAFIDDSMASVRRVFLARPDGSDRKFVSEGESPSWSSDGSNVAYTKRDCDFYYYYYSTCRNRLWITDPEIGRSRPVGMLPILNVAAPAWSPAGNVIAFIHLDTHLLYLISPDGGSPLLVATGKARWVNDPSWSPDGNRIAFSCMVDQDNLDVCVVNRDGTEFVRLTNGSQTEFDPAWSPDGNSIAYVTNVEGPFQIATMATDGSGFRKLTDGFSPSWSRGGTSIAFSRELGTFTMRPDGTALTQITSGKQRDIAWRP
jgi:TolB protein